MFTSKIHKFKIADIEFTITIDGSFIKSDIFEFYSTTDEAVKRMHVHALHELFFVKDMPLTVLTENGVSDFKNCVLCIPPMFVHSSIRHNDYRILFSYKITSEKKSKFAEFLNSFFSSSIPVYVDIDNSTSVYFEQLYKLFNSSDTLSDDVVTSLLKLIFYNIYSYNTEVEKHDKEETRDSYLITIDRILGNYQQNITLSSMAQALNLSTKQTSRIIRKYYKCTLAELVTMERLNVASGLLSNSDMPISDIVEYINFSSESYFFHQFKKAYGCTPLKYRKKKQQSV